MFRIRHTLRYIKDWVLEKLPRISLQPRKRSSKPVVLFSILAIVTFVVILVLKKSNPDLKIISPLAKSFSLLSYNGRREPPKKIIYGYLPYWTLKDEKYLQYDKLTDIAYFGIHIQEDGNFLKIVDGEYEPGYNNWVNNEKVLEVIENSKKYDVNFALTIISHRDNISDAFLDCRECWDTLADNVIAELVKYDITDVNLNFEYVEYTPREKAKQYTQFTRFMNDRLDATFPDSKLVVSTFADSAIRPRVTIIEEIGKAADQIFIMGYDFHRPTSDTAGPVSPIGGKGVHAEYDIETMMKDYVAYIPPSKIILGVPYYGYNWVVERNEEYAKRIVGRDDIGYSQSQTYEAIMETILTVRPEIKWDELGKSPYFTYISPETLSLRQVYFDNVDSLAVKYDMVNEKGYAGVGIWALGYDGGYNELWNLLKVKFID